MSSDSTQYYLQNRDQKDFSFRRRCNEIARERSMLATWCTLLAIMICAATGWYLLLTHSWHRIFGAPLIAEAMILSTYLRHECAHLLAFKTRRNNEIIGEIISWFSGDHTTPFKEYRIAHLRHHSEQVDLVGVELSEIICGYPTMLRNCIFALEEIYVPIVFLIVRADGILAGLRSPDSRSRAIISFSILSLTGFVLIWHSLAALLAYLAGIILKIHCIRFSDAFQHNYDRVPSGERTMPRGWHYEQENTFSFKFPGRFSMLNLFILNFGLHNAHHAVPTCPWYHLPTIDRLLRENERVGKPNAKLPLLQDDPGIDLLLHSYHRSRVRRIKTSGSATVVRADEDFSKTSFEGIFSDNLLG